MVISLSELMNVPDGVLQESVPVGLASFEYQGENYSFLKKENVELTVQNLGERKIRIELVGAVALAVPCDRCLKEVSVPVDISMSAEFDFSGSNEESVLDLNETNYIDGYELDVDKLVYEEILLGFPMKVLCKEDCKGICKVCGADLNEGECDCDRTELDPRMSVIRDIFNNFKEV